MHKYRSKSKENKHRVKELSKKLHQQESITLHEVRESQEVKRRNLEIRQRMSELI